MPIHTKIAAVVDNCLSLPGMASWGAEGEMMDLVWPWPLCQVLFWAWLG